MAKLPLFAGLRRKEPWLRTGSALAFPRHGRPGAVGESGNRVHQMSFCWHGVVSTCHQMGR